ncbi:MAG: hypothetical protein PHH44_01840 [bacterium]|nr:hypothetical protein [bacterium]
MNTKQKALNIIYLVIIVVAVKLIFFPGGDLAADHQMKVKAVGSRETAKRYEREPFAPYQGEMSITIQPSTSLGKFTADEFAQFRISKIKQYPQLNIFPSDYDPFAYPHKLIYKDIVFGTVWRNAAEGYISNPYLLIILSAASYTEPLEKTCQLTEVKYKNRSIEENYTGYQAAQFFQIFDPARDFPGAVRIWMVNAKDAGLRYATVDKAKCENIDFTWHNTPDNIANSVYSLHAYYHVGRYQENNISPNCQRATLKIREKDKYTCIYVKLWVNEPKNQEEKEDFAYIIKVIP